MTEILVKMFIKNPEDVKSAEARKRYGDFASIVGVIGNFILFLLKTALGIISGSIAIVGDAFNNLSDVGSNVVTYLGFKLASQPADEDHPFGHGRYEYLAGLLIAVFVILVGVEVVKTSISKIITPEPVEFNWFVVIGLAASIAVKFWMGNFYSNIGRKINSTSLIAAEADSKSDCISTAATAIGMVAAKLFSVNIDGWLGLFVGLFILWAGYKIAMETLEPLLGGIPDREIVDGIHEIIHKYPICIGVHDMIIHDYGPGRMMGSAHVEVPADCNILEAHDQIDNAEREITEVLHMPFVIHMDPVEMDCEEVQRYRNVLIDILVSMDEGLTFHDFRMVRGATHTNLIFDIVVPHSCKMQNSQIKKIVDSAFRATGKEIFTVITFDRSYIG
ncbi:MAG: cation transporter [Ruminococcaceae bacterium]|nr:cation transporter [Oscillospiraceae bacterium]